MRKLTTLILSFILFFSSFIFIGGSVLASEEIAYGADASFGDKELTLEEILTYTLESQYLSRNLNDSIVEKFGKVKPYIGIMENNEDNVSSLEELFSVYGYTLIEDKSASHVLIDEKFDNNLSSSYEEEMKNIVMYETFLKVELPDDVRATIENLKSDSIKNLQEINKSLKEIDGIKGETTLDNNFVTRFFNWLGRSFDGLFTK